MSRLAAVLCALLLVAAGPAHAAAGPAGGYGKPPAAPRYGYARPPSAAVAGVGLYCPHPGTLHCTCETPATKCFASP